MVMMAVPFSHMAVLLLAAIRIVTADARLHENYVPLDFEGNVVRESNTHDAPAPASAAGEEEESLIAMQFAPDPNEGRDILSMIASGELHLAALRYSPRSFSTARGYSDVHGEFCAYDPALHSSYATVSEIMGASYLCGEHRYTLPLHEVVAAVEHSSSSSSSRSHGTTTTSTTMRPLPVSGLIFHEGHSGAGLISGAIATFRDALVVSEHPALRDALGACDVLRNRHRYENCSPDAQRSLVSDVVSLLSRTRDAGVHRAYFKLSSESSAYVREVRAVLPDAAWAFVYRDADHALAKTTGGRRGGSCVKSRRNPSSALVAKSSGRRIDMEGLTNHEVCALHLSSLLDVATREHADTGTGMLISYDRDLTSDAADDVLLNTILPHFGLGGEIDDSARERVAGVLSKRSGRGGVGDWAGEVVVVSEEVRAASRAFVWESTEAMDNLARASRVL
ncbi:hypothetical protein ACHAW5_007702 [Stephanodiscus triporus]|uniref:Uncharacterized protein n=1 Tax=Stephanodiscus triporus TaxID=2934178 RepID=A0ABD3MGS0_9STRA